MVDQNPEFNLSPLDQIRQTEAEVARKIAASRKEAERILDEARHQVVVIKQDAQASGTDEGNARYKAIISKAEEESRALIAEAQYQARLLGRRGKRRMPAAVNAAVNLIIHVAEDGDAK